MTGHSSSNTNAAQAHIDAILALPYINVAAIRQKKFKIVLDTVNGNSSIGSIDHELILTIIVRRWWPYYA
jgi:hypothetical protein